ncbi:MAG: hypothetical protein AAFW73_25580 [Bacteroidota bacterium]
MNYFDEIFSYCEGELSYEEMQRFEAKLATDPALQAEFAAYRKGEVALSAVLIDEPTLKPTDRKPRKINPGRFLGGILVLALLLFLLFPQQSPVIILEQEHGQTFFDQHSGQVLSSLPPLDLSKGQIKRLDSVFQGTYRAVGDSARAAEFQNLIRTFAPEDSLHYSMYLGTSFLSALGLGVNQIVSFNIGYLTSENNLSLIHTYKQLFDWYFDHRRVVDRYSQPFLQDSSVHFFNLLARDSVARPIAGSPVDRVALHPDGKHVIVSSLGPDNSNQSYFWQKEPSVFKKASFELVKVANQYGYQHFLGPRESERETFETLADALQKSALEKTEVGMLLMDNIGDYLFSPSGKYSIVGGEFYWKDKTLVPIAQLNGGLDSVLTLENVSVSPRDLEGYVCKFSPEEEYLVYTEFGEKKELQVLHLPTLTKRKTPKLAKPICNAYFASEAALYLVLQNGDLWLLDLANPNELTFQYNMNNSEFELDSIQARVNESTEMDIEKMYADSTVFYSLFSPNQRYILNSYGMPPFVNRFTLTDHQTQSVILDDPSYYFATFSNDSQYLLLSSLRRVDSSYRNCYTLFDLELQRVVGEFQTQSNSVFSIFDFSPDDQYIFISNEKGLERWTLVEHFGKDEITFSHLQLERWDHTFFPYPFYFEREAH